MKFYNYNTLKNILEDFVSVHNYEELLMQYKIEKYILEQSKNKLQKSVRVIGYNDKILKIKTSSSTWKFEMMMRKESLIKSINDSFGKNTVTDIIIN
jgi:hypothetical protein